jgi:hypothetical protein
MSKKNNGNPFRLGEVISVPPGMSMPPELGFTAFWEKELGLLYVSTLSLEETSKEAPEVDLSIGRLIRFEWKMVIIPSERWVLLAYNITNV